MTGPSFIAGHHANFYQGIETASFPVASIPAPAVPTLQWLGWAEVPAVTAENAARVVYGIGSRKPQIITSGTQIHSVNAACFIGPQTKSFTIESSSEADYQFCLATGLSNALGNGFSKLMRFSQCDSLTLALERGSAKEIVANGTFWGLAEEDGTALTPTSGQIAGAGTPLCWHDVRSISIASVNLRDVLLSATLTIRRNLVRKIARPDYGSNAWSRTVYAIRRGNMAYECDLVFDTPDAAKFALGLSGSQTLTSAFQITAQDVAASQPLTLAGSVGKISSATRDGASSQSLNSSVRLTLLDLTVS